MTAVAAPIHSLRVRPFSPDSSPRIDGAIQIPASARTHAGFREWIAADALPDHCRTAYIDGEIYLDMSKEDIETHVAVKGEISRVVLTLSRKLRQGKFYADGVLVSNEAAQVSNNPDACFLSFASLRSGKVRLVPKEGQPGRFTEIEGTPDWLLEVISDNSVHKETERLRNAYHRAGIPEYWLIDARGEAIDFQLLLWRKAGYVAAKSKAGWLRSKVFDRSFKLTRRPDALGLWQYTLHVRAK